MTNVRFKNNIYGGKNEWWKQKPCVPILGLGILMGPFWVETLDQKKKKKNPADKGSLGS